MRANKIITFFIIIILSFYIVCAFGDDGLDGTVGDIGLDGIGDIGLDGAIGDSGLDGTVGDIGLDGAIGDNGLDGTVGDIGLDGTVGDDGLDGTVGDSGLGDIGDMGGDLGNLDDVLFPDDSLDDIGPLVDDIPEDLPPAPEYPLPNTVPIANAGPDQTVAVGDVVNFNGSASYDPDGNIVSYNWDFGDTGTATGKEVNHVFTSTGTYNVTLTVTDNQGATGSDTAVVIANGRPTAVLVCPAQGTVNEIVNFDVSQSSDDKKIVNYTLNFGNGNTVDFIDPTNFTFEGQTYSNPVHKYNAPGSFTVNLTVKDEGNLEHSASCPITITAPNQPPIAHAGPDQTVAVGNVVNFNGSASYDPDGNIVSYNWDFGDTGTATGKEVNHVFTSTGTYSVTLTVTDNQGATGSDTAVVIANGRPTAVAGGPYSGYVNEAITFDGSASTDDETIVSYQWGFGDGSTGTGVKPTHTYTNTGTFTITLTVTDNNGLSHSDTTTATITTKPNNAPTLNPIGDKTINENEDLKFTISATDPDNDPLTFSATNLPSGASFDTDTLTWTPDDGQAGTYQVTFTVSDGQLTDSETITITVNPAPAPAFIPSERLIFSKIRLSNEFLEPGELLTAHVKLFNDANQDLENLILTLYIYDLAEWQTLGPFDLEKGEKITRTFHLEIPDHIDAGEYDIRFVASNEESKIIDHRVITII